VSEGDDPFADLGPERDPGTERRRAIGEKLAERDRTHPEPAPERPEVPRPGNKYAWVVGIVLLMFASVVLLRSIASNDGEGLRGPEPGTKLPDFAVPLILGGVEGDANLCQRRPCSERAGPIPACEVRAPGVLNVCELREDPLVLTFVFDRAANCLPQVDRTERVGRSLRGVRFATVFFSHKNRDELRTIVTRRRWAQPVGLDRDGQVSNRYGVGVCPTTVFAKAGGAVLVSRLGNLTEEEIRRDARRLSRRG
jgi:hypothetical protein